MSSKSRIHRGRGQQTEGMRKAQRARAQVNEQTDRRMIPWRPAQSNNAATHETTTNASMEM
jgi:hypothetical protein